MASVSEFDLIERYFSPLSLIHSESVLTGTGDDCAVIITPPGASLCFSIDSMVEGVHFPRNIPPFELAYRSLAAAMSDLAAMGATPSFFTLALTLPEADSKWLEGFSSGLKVLVDRYQFPLLGGDTTRGPLTISIQVHGYLSKPALLRSGRIDEKIKLDLPVEKARRFILNTYSKHPLASDVDLDKIATETDGFTCADLSTLLLKSAYCAARNRQKDISMENVNTALVEMKKSRSELEAVEKQPSKGSMNFDKLFSKESIGKVKAFLSSLFKNQNNSSADNLDFDDVPESNDVD